MKKLGIFVAFFILITAFGSTSYATNEFLTDYNITYKINPNGETQVTNNITITNQENDIIASTYSLSVKQLSLYDVKAYTKDEKLAVSTSKNADETRIDITFDNFVVGEGRQNQMMLEYKTRDFATKTGNVWNINIPGAQGINATSSYNITLQVPKVFGQKSYLSPIPQNQNESVIEKETYSNYFYSKEAVTDTNISGSFGSFQVFNFRLKYQLENPNLFYGFYEIALPSDISGLQQISYENLDPKPLKLRVDVDGNTIATYRLKPKQELQVQFIGKAKIQGRQIDPNSAGQFSEIPPQIKSEYTKAMTYWESDDAVIKELASKLKDPKLNVSQNAKKIYDYIVINYTYDLDYAKNNFVTRKGAKAAILDKSKWACMEFTDVFIAISRAMGIPAREINGFAMSGSNVTKPVSVPLKSADFLHAWPQYYDPAFGWVQIDPTWGDTSNTDYFTKLDTDHVAFVIKGIDSEYPYPAGTYRKDLNNKLVEVDYSQNYSDSDFETKTKVSKTINLNLFKVIQGYSRYKITNVGKTSIILIDGQTIFPDKSAFVYIKSNSQSYEVKNSYGDFIKVTY